MTEIDVPDWVVKAADEAGDEFAKTHTMSMYASLADMQRDCVRHMLTAALGALVVREGFFDPDVMDHLRSNVIDPVGVLRRKSNGISTVAIYTLRQEKPE